MTDDLAADFERAAEMLLRLLDEACDALEMAEAMHQASIGHLKVESEARDVEIARLTKALGQKTVAAS